MQALPLLDFKTLEVVNLVVAIIAAVVWATTGLAYRGLPAARYLFGSSLAVAFGAALKTGLTPDSAAWISILALESIVCGLWLLYSGVRSFFGRPVRARQAAAALLVTLALLIVFHQRWLLREAIFVFAQILPLFLLLPLFVKHGSRNSFGIQLAAAGAVIGIFSYLTIGLACVAKGLELYAIPSLEHVQTYGLLLGMVSASLLVFGIALMIIEHLLHEAENMAKRDELTGISNRRDFMFQIERVHALCAAANMPYSVLLIDIDKFKNWNDSYGHAVGDEALRHFTRTALDQLHSDTRLLARTGGDEFSLLLPGEGAEQAAEIAKTLVEQVRARAVCVNGKVLHLTVSVGVAVYMPGSQAGYNDILAHADVALYGSKNAGRSRYTVFDKRNVRDDDAPFPARFRLVDKPGAPPAGVGERRKQGLPQSG